MPATPERSVQLVTINAVSLPAELSECVSVRQAGFKWKSFD
jgi:hypothetical protein